MLRSFDTVTKLKAKQQKLFEHDNRILSKYT